jgi:hypothetical protein
VRRIISPSYFILLGVKAAKAHQTAKKAKEQTERAAIDAKKAKWVANKVKKAIGDKEKALQKQVDKEIKAQTSS